MKTETGETEKAPKLSGRCRYNDVFDVPYSFRFQQAPTNGGDNSRLVFEQKQPAVPLHKNKGFIEQGCRGFRGS